MPKSLLIEEQERIRSLQIPGQLPFPEQTPTGPLGYSTRSSIAPATTTVDLSTRSAQPKHMLIEPLRILMKAEAQNNESLAVTDAEIKVHQANLKQVDEERAEELKKSAKANESRHTWSTLSTVSEYVADASIVGVGLAIASVPGGQVPGGSLVVSGGAGLLRRGLTDIGLLDDFAYRSWVEYGTYGVQIIFGLGGAYGAYLTGTYSALAGGQALLGRISTTLGVTGTLVSSVGQVGTKVFDRQIAYSRAHLLELDLTTTGAQNDMTNLAAEMSNMVRTTGEIGEYTKREIRALDHQQTLD